MHNRPGSARTQRTRVELNDYDENLLLDRSYVHTPVDGHAKRSSYTLTTPVDFVFHSTFSTVLLSNWCKSESDAACGAPSGLVRRTLAI